MAAAFHRTSPYPSSLYPQPHIDPCPVFETSYAHEFGSHPSRDVLFYRSRAPSNNSTSASSIYPQHGSTSFSLAVHRTDSKGFRQTFAQPPSVNAAYATTHLLPSMSQFSATSSASSRPTYAVCKDRRGEGPVFGTDDQNTLLFDPSVAAKKEQTQELLKTQMLSTSGLSSSSPASANGAASSAAPRNGTDASATGGAASTSQRSSSVFTDPLPSNPLMYVHRKPRTVYKRAYGRCM